MENKNYFYIKILVSDHCKILGNCKKFLRKLTNFGENFNKILKQWRLYNSFEHTSERILKKLEKVLWKFYELLGKLRDFEDIFRKFHETREIVIILGKLSENFR